MILLIKRFVSQPLIYNAFYILGITIFPSLIGLAFWGIASRLYSVAEIGQASAVFSAVVLISGLSGLGVSMGVIRFLPAFPKPRDLLNTVYCFNILSSVIVSAIFVWGLKYWLPSLIELQQSKIYFIGFLAFVLATTLGAVVRDTFIARRRASYSFVYTVIANSLRLIFIFLGTAWGAAGLVSSGLFAYTIALLISWFGFLPAIEAGYRFKAILNLAILRLIVPFSMGNYLANFLVQMPQTILPMIVFQMLGAQANGYAYLAIMIGSAVPSPGLALASSAFAEGANDPGRSREILSKASLIGVLSTLAIAAVVVLLTDWIFLLFALDSPIESIKLLRWLALASPIIAFNQLYFTHLRLVNRVLSLIVFSSIIAFLTVFISIYYLPKIGIVACGIGVLVGNAVVAIPFAILILVNSEIENWKFIQGIHRL